MLTLIALPSMPKLKNEIKVSINEISAVVGQKVRHDYVFDWISETEMCSVSEGEITIEHSIGRYSLYLELKIYATMYGSGRVNESDGLENLTTHISDINIENFGISFDGDQMRTGINQADLKQSILNNLRRLYA